MKRVNKIRAHCTMFTFSSVSTHFGADIARFTLAKSISTINYWVYGKIHKTFRPSFSCTIFPNTDRKQSFVSENAWNSTSSFVLLWPFPMANNAVHRMAWLNKLFQWKIAQIKRDSLPYRMCNACRRCVSHEHTACTLYTNIWRIETVLLVHRELHGSPFESYSSVVSVYEECAQQTGDSAKSKKQIHCQLNQYAMVDIVFGLHLFTRNLSVYTIQYTGCPISIEIVSTMRCVCFLLECRHQTQSLPNSIIWNEKKN